MKPEQNPTRHFNEWWLNAKSFIGLVLSTLLFFGCAGPEVIPQELKDKVDAELSFVQVKNNPSTFQGRLIVVGGTVLSATLLKEGTQIEVLHLPLNKTYEPKTTLTNSQGRFLAFKKGFLDPATLPIGTRITVVGEITGSRTLPLDETQYTYLALAIKKLTIWPTRLPADWFRPYPYFGGYWGSYWGPYWGPPYGGPPYWWDSYW